MTESPVSSRALALRAAELLADQKAAEIVIIDVSENSSIGDYFVVATGRSDVHVKAACGAVEIGLREYGRRPLSSEGVQNGHWALLDYGEVVVHVFQHATRQLYDLERLWNESPRETFFEGPTAAATRR